LECGQRHDSERVQEFRMMDAEFKLEKYLRRVLGEEELKKEATKQAIRMTPSIWTISLRQIVDP